MDVDVEGWEEERRETGSVSVILLYNAKPRGCGVLLPSIPVRLGPWTLIVGSRFSNNDTVFVFVDNLFVFSKMIMSQQTDRADT